MDSIQVTRTQRHQTGFTDVTTQHIPPGWTQAQEKVKPVEKTAAIQALDQNLKQPEKDGEIIRQLLGKLEKNLDKLQTVGLQFTQHKETGRTVIRVVEEKTGKVIREIPPESFLDVVAKLDQMVGILFDERV